MAGHDNGGAVAELGGQWFQILHAWLMNCQNTKQQKILKNLYILNNELGGQCHELWIVRLDKSKTKYQRTRSLYNYVFMFNFNGMLIPLEKRSTYELGHLSLSCFAWWGHNNVWSQFLLLCEPIWTPLSLTSSPYCWAVMAEQWVSALQFVHSELGEQARPSLLRTGTPLEDATGLQDLASPHRGTCLQLIVGTWQQHSDHHHHQKLSGTSSQTLLHKLSISESRGSMHVQWESLPGISAK